MFDLPFLLQLENIVKEGAPFQLIPLFVAVGDMNHAHLNVVGAESCKEVLEAGTCRVKVTGPGMLSVSPDGAYMALDNHLVATSLQRISNIGTCLGVGVIDVDIVHATIECHGHQLERCCTVELLEATTADTDFTHHQTGVAQRAEFHVALFFLLPTGDNSDKHDCGNQTEYQFLHFYHCLN